MTQKSIEWIIGASKDRIKELNKSKILFFTFLALFFLFLFIIIKLFNLEYFFIEYLIIFFAILIFIAPKFKEKKYIIDEYGVSVIYKKYIFYHKWIDIKDYSLNNYNSDNSLFMILDSFKYRSEIDCFIFLKIKPNKTLNINTIRGTVLRVPLDKKDEVISFIDSKIKK